MGSDNLRCARVMACVGTRLLWRLLHTAGLLRKSLNCGAFADCAGPDVPGHVGLPQHLHTG
jgi:hypothetical protein